LGNFCSSLGWFFNLADASGQEKGFYRVNCFDFGCATWHRLHVCQDWRGMILAQFHGRLFMVHGLQLLEHRFYSAKRSIVRLFRFVIPFIGWIFFKA